MTDDLFSKPLLEWPDQIENQKFLPSQDLEKCGRLIRCAQYLKAEVKLLALLAQTSELDRKYQLLSLLAFSAYVQFKGNQFIELVETIRRINPGSTLSRYLVAQSYLFNSDYTALSSLDAAFWKAEGNGSRLLTLVRVGYLIGIRQYSDAERLLNVSKEPDSIEVLSCKAKILAGQYRYSEAADLLQPVVARVPSDIRLHSQYITHLFDAKDSERSLPAIRNAVQIHGENIRLLQSLTSLKLLQRQPGVARRYALQEQAFNSIHQHKCGHISNLIIAYEHSGYASWIKHILPQLYLDNNILLYDLLCNMILQLASCESPAVNSCTKKFISIIRKAPGFRKEYIAAGGPPLMGSASLKSTSSPLRIAWYSGDINNHPVARFLHGFFKASEGQLHNHHMLVSLSDYGEKGWHDHFKEISGLEVIDFGSIPEHMRVGPARELKADIAVDLSGWTAGHFMTGFLAGISPMQISYLGYFATTGLPNMDYWIGDENLFPDPMKEWHSEEVYRLSRCFIAWQPSEILPEFHASISEAESGPVRFGSFNHPRKLSDATLLTWGTLLSSIKDSRLVLKANHQDDPATKALLRRRMLRAGLDPEKIIWLPFAPSAQEHLEQYRHIDIALDCFPNGGCTTTCEALWMGVPTIALAGKHYVSRMSTAVLRGGDLPEFVCENPQLYVDKAVQIASNLNQLRSNRDKWRKQLQGSSLGNAADLMKQLEKSLSFLYQKKLRSN